MIEKINAFAVGDKTYADLDEAKGAALIEAYNAGLPSDQKTDRIPVAWLVEQAPVIIDILRQGTRRASSKAGRPRKNRKVVETKDAA